jgi:quercetin dioxygenase-like cupin family protein
MQRKLKWLCVAAVIGVAAYGSTVLATPQSGFTSTSLAKGRLERFDAKTKTGDWKSRLKTKGTSDLEVVEVEIAPGGSSGWHSHPGPSMVIVKSGTATFFLGDDPTCTPHTVQAGQSFVEGGGEVHHAPNEGNVELVNIVTSLVPAGAARRIDEPSPGNCPF